MKKAVFIDVNVKKKKKQKKYILVVKLFIRNLINCKTWHFVVLLEQ